jgi:predicted DNA binding protein
MKNPWSQPYHVVLEIENKHCRVLKRLTSLGLKSLKLADIRGSQRGSIRHLLELDPNEVKKIPPELRGIRLKLPAKDKTSIWFESEGCDVCNSILSNDAFLVSGKSVADSTINYSFMVPSFEAYKQILSAIEKSGYKVRVLKMGHFEPKKGVLTEKQERIFWLALKSGFFDYPRKIGTSELAMKIGISPSTLSEITRRGTRRLLEHYYKNEP